MLVLLWVGCTKTVAPEVAVPEPVAPAPVVPADPMAPRPFTVEQLRAAFPVGTKLRFRIEAEGKPAIEERWEVVAADAVGCTIASKVHDAASGEVVEDEGGAVSTWAELVEHAAFPVALTKIEDGSVTVPAGTFETRRYTVSDLDGTVRVFDFAPSLPGPPVKLTATRDGAVALSMTLLERS